MRVFVENLNKIVWAVFSIHALPWPKIRLLNFVIHQFFHSERLINSKSILKEVYISSLKKILWVKFYWENHFRNLKLAYRIWTSIRLSIVNNNFLGKDIWKGIVLWRLKEIVTIDFSRHTLSKAEIGLPNLSFNDFFFVVNN